MIIMIDKRINIHIVSKLKRIFASFGLQKQYRNYELSVRIIQSFNRWATCEGKPGLQRAKMMSNNFVRQLMGRQDDIPLSSKYKSMIKHALILASHSNLARVYWTSIFLTYRFIRIPVSYDTTTITSGYKGKYLTLLLYTKSFVRTTSSFSSTFVEQNWSAIWKWHISGAGGPNGKIAFTRYLDDFKALSKSALRWKLKFLLYTLPVRNREQALDDIENTFIDCIDKGDSNAIHSRLVFLSDKGGKTRVVAILDILSQSLLKIVHQRCNRVLRRLEQDGTFDQDKLSAHVKKMSEDNVFLASIDLTAATDRMPALYQVCVLVCCRILSPLQAIGWWLVTTKRSFVVNTPDGQKSIRYSVGQPMGALSSWPVMAISHHVLVRWSYMLAYGPEKEPIYAIIGDDLVIADEAASLTYLKLISLLGMEFSADKSYFQRGVAEFAKRLFRRGEDLSPFPTGALEFKKNTVITNTLAVLSEVDSRKWSTTLSTITGITPVPWRQLAELAALSPSSPTSVLDVQSRKEYRIFSDFLLLEKIKYFSQLKVVVESTHSFIIENPGSGLYRVSSPYCQIGMDNSESYPVRMLRDDNRLINPVPCTGFGFISFDSRVWPRGLPPLEDKRFTPGPTWKEKTDDDLFSSSLLRFNKLVPGYFTHRCVGPQVGDIPLHDPGKNGSEGEV